MIAVASLLAVTVMRLARANKVLLRGCFGRRCVPIAPGGFLGHKKWCWLAFLEKKIASTEEKTMDRTSKSR